MITPFSPQIRYSLTKLGQYLRNPADDELQGIIQGSRHHNAWFTEQEVEKALAGIAAMLSEKSIEHWFSLESRGFNATLDESYSRPRVVGLILAGNLPLVGFHDILCTLVCGRKALIKLSAQDKLLIPYLLKKWTEFHPELGEYIEFTEKLENFDAVIATGSNNSSRYFEHYFSKVPNIIRKNRNSVAILTGDESKEDLYALGNDIFDYYGLGCRNVSKLYVREGFDFVKFFEAIEPFSYVFNHHKYANNYDYNKAICLVNKDIHYDNGFVLLKKDGSDNLSSPLATVFFEEYGNDAELVSKLNTLEDNIQVIVSKNQPEGLNTGTFSFGCSQSPDLWDYADGVNTVRFLLSL